MTTPSDRDPLLGIDLAGQMNIHLTHTYYHSKAGCLKALLGVSVDRGDMLAVHTRHIEAASQPCKHEWPGHSVS